MPHSYVSNLLHYVFSTKERFPFIDQELESRSRLELILPSQSSLGSGLTIKQREGSNRRLE